MMCYGHRIALVFIWFMLVAGLLCPPDCRTARAQFRREGRAEQAYLAARRHHQQKQLAYQQARAAYEAAARTYEAAQGDYDQAEPASRKAQLEFARAQETYSEARRAYDDLQKNYEKALSERATGTAVGMMTSPDPTISRRGARLFQMMVQAMTSRDAARQASLQKQALQESRRVYSTPLPAPGAGPLPLPASPTALPNDVIPAGWTRDLTDALPRPGKADTKYHGTVYGIDRQRNIVYVRPWWSMQAHSTAKVEWVGTVTPSCWVTARTPVFRQGAPEVRVPLEAVAVGAPVTVMNCSNQPAARALAVMLQARPVNPDPVPWQEPGITPAAGDQQVSGWINRIDLEHGKLDIDVSRPLSAANQAPPAAVDSGDYAYEQSSVVVHEFTTLLSSNSGAAAPKLALSDTSVWQEGLPITAVITHDRFRRPLARTLKVDGPIYRVPLLPGTLWQHIAPPPGGDVTALAFSPDSKVLAVAAVTYPGVPFDPSKQCAPGTPGTASQKRLNTITLHDARSGALLRHLGAVEKQLTKSQDAVWFMQFTPGGKTLVIYPGAARPVTKIDQDPNYRASTYYCDVATGRFKEVQRRHWLIGPRDALWPQSKTFAASYQYYREGGRKDKLGIFDAYTGALIREWPRPYFRTLDAKLSLDENTVAVLFVGFRNVPGSSRTLTLWDAATGKLKLSKVMPEILMEGTPDKYLSYTPDGNRLIIQASPMQMLFLDARTLEVKRTRMVEHSYTPSDDPTTIPMFGFALPASRRIMVTSDGGLFKALPHLQVWSLDTVALRPAPRMIAPSQPVFAVSPDGRLAAAGGRYQTGISPVPWRFNLRVWDIDATPSD